jgi:23S rRNA (uracil1939-C5)-methyltransferase
MAKFFKAKKVTAKRQSSIDIKIEQFNHDGYGIGYADDKICFVQGALPGEQVKAKVVEDKAKMRKAKTTKIVQASEHRIEPDCKHFDLCGGCQLQYVSSDAQLQLKQQAITDLFKRFANVASLPWQSPLITTPWHYRRTARIGVWHERKNNEFIVGFRQQNAKQLTPISSCSVLVEEFAELFDAFAQLLPKLKCGRAVTHIEVVKADNANLVVVRHTQPLSEVDSKMLIKMGQDNQWFMVSELEKGQLVGLTEQQLPQLHYNMPQYDTQLAFRLGDFIQVNADINRQMVIQAEQWLDLNEKDTLLDLFCGIGNFSLPLATICDKVVGVEGVDAMVEQATYNATQNAQDNALFYQADLSVDMATNKPQWLQQPFSKVLLDPARAGAQQVMKTVIRLKAQKILYVSCDPLSLARDSSELIASGYRLTKVALMDMFSHTKHVEVMVLFEK